MATYDDFDGVYFTVMGLRLYHPEVADRVAFLVVDNNPCGPAAWALKRLESHVPALRYVPVGDVQGTAVRDRVFAEANSDWVLCVDSHVQLVPGALARLVEFLEAHPDCTDLLQGPLLSEDLGRLATHWEPGWHKGMPGHWGTDPRGADIDGQPFEIPMQGLGLFCCRTDAWLGFNPRFRGHGGEEGYLHEKFRAAGRRTLCLPFLRWVHRFARPAGPGYAITWPDRLRNYLVGWQELGLDTEPLLDHFRGLVGDPEVDAFLARWQAEQANPFDAFDAIVCLNLDDRPDRWARLRQRLRALGIADRVRRISAVPIPDNHHIGCALSHRRAIEQAHREGWDNVLVLEDDVVFLRGAPWVLRRSIRELARQQWVRYYLGGCYLGRDFSKRFPLAGGCAHLEAVHGITTTHAIAHHRRGYDHLLAELPGDPDGMRDWISSRGAIDQYLATNPTDGVFRAVPVVASQESLARYEHPDLRDQFDLDGELAGNA